MILTERMTARLDGDFAVFLIGMRLNRPWRLDRIVPVFASMGPMLRELYAQPELGLISHEMWFARTTLMVQYWRSLDLLLDYARRRDAAHLPAWSAFQQRIGTDGSVGIWHETYLARAGSYENVYVNMPPFGLGRAGTLQPARGAYKSARERLGADQP